MPRRRKIHDNNTAIFLTTSVEEGFMFPQNPLIDLILRSCFIKAQLAHPGLVISHFFANTTHVHLIGVVYNPDDVKDFMARFKAESAHAINRLLGRKKRTLWCAGYDSPPMLDAAKVMEKIAYCYINASRDGQVDSIDHYPGLSTWSHFLNGETELHGFNMPRNAFRKLKNTSISLHKGQRIVEKLTANRKSEVFTINPDLWMDVFGVPLSERAAINQKIIDDVYKFEATERERRDAENQGVIGVEKLRKTPIGAPYTPQRTGRKMICLATDISIRAAYIALAKERYAKAELVYIEWKKGNRDMPFPLGLYPPSFPKLANRWSRHAVECDPHW